MEAPEKIYISFDKDITSEVLSQKAEGDIEYVRSDAFIEKATEWLSNIPLEDMEYKYDNFGTSEGWHKMIKDFEEYLKK